MAAPTLTETFLGSGTYVHTWTLTTADAVGTSLILPGAPDRTVFIFGTFGSGTVTLEGSPNNTDWFVLSDPQGNAISKTDKAVEAVAENAPYIRAQISGSTAATVTVTLVSRK